MDRARNAAVRHRALEPIVPGEGAGATHLVIWSAALYLGTTMLDLRHKAWGAELSTDYDERSRITSRRERLSTVGQVALLGVLLLVMALSYALYSILAVLCVVAIAHISDRAPRFRALLLPAILCPLYREIMRWVRLRALVAELLRRNYKDSYLPDTAWMHTPRY
ncbi:MAG: hypothetical protein ACI8QZ_003328 [Chlamydiales bacterium]|jgi:hypothetical protein